MLNVLCWSFEFVIIVWLGLTIAEAEGEFVDPVKLV